MFICMCIMKIIIAELFTNKLVITYMGYIAIYMLKILHAQCVYSRIFIDEIIDYYYYYYIIIL